MQGVDAPTPSTSLLPQFRTAPRPIQQSCCRGKKQGIFCEREKVEHQTKFDKGSRDCIRFAHVTASHSTWGAFPLSLRKKWKILSKLGGRFVPQQRKHQDWKLAVLSKHSFPYFPLMHDKSCLFSAYLMGSMLHCHTYKC